MLRQNGAEYGSQSQDCWKYVMRCATFVLSIGGDGGPAAAGGKGGKRKAPKRAASKSPQPAARPKGPFTCNVRKTYGIFNPLSLVNVTLTQPSDTLLCLLATHPLPSEDVILL